ncbi:Zn finger protein [Lokiarchaeota virus WyrdV1]|nr:Zn finger protein [Lokiarchaeota virus WyrdV1]
MRFCEICSKCEIGLMIHNALYTWKCNHCGFSYKIDPSGRIPKITILNRGNNKRRYILPLDRKNNHRGVKC